MRKRRWLWIGQTLRKLANNIHVIRKFVLWNIQDRNNRGMPKTRQRRDLATESNNPWRTYRELLELTKEEVACREMVGGLYPLGDKVRKRT